MPSRFLLLRRVVAVACIVVRQVERCRLFFQVSAGTIFSFAPPSSSSTLPTSGVTLAFVLGVTLALVLGVRTYSLRYNFGIILSPVAGRASGCKTTV